MARRTVGITEEAYERLKALKKGWEDQFLGRHCAILPSAAETRRCARGDRGVLRACQYGWEGFPGYAEEPAATGEVRLGL